MRNNKLLKAFIAKSKTHSTSIFFPKKILIISEAQQCDLYLFSFFPIFQITDLAYDRRIVFILTRKVTKSKRKSFIYVLFSPFSRNQHTHTHILGDKSKGRERRKFNKFAQCTTEN
jgi:hypothetical protein